MSLGDCQGSSNRDGDSDSGAMAKADSIVCPDREALELHGSNEMSRKLFAKWQYWTTIPIRK
jgi:hypothetical protein